MAPHSDLLQILAQIFIAFAGFAGVVAAFGEIKLAPEATAFRVRLMVAVALLMLLAALAPLALAAAGLGPDAVARLSASFFASGAIAVSLWSWRLLGPRDRDRKPATQRIAALLYVVTIALTVALFAVGAGFAQAFASAIYIGSLYFGVVLCSYYFLMLMLAISLGKRD